MFSNVYQYKNKYSSTYWVGILNMYFGAFYPWLICFIFRFLHTYRCYIYLILNTIQMITLYGNYRVDKVYVQLYQLL